MIDIKELKKEIEKYRILKVPVIILSILILINIFSYLFFIHPVKRDIENNNREYLALKTNLNQKIQFKSARKDMEEFYKALQSKNDFTKIMNFISNSVKRNGLSMPAIAYQQEKSEEDKKTSAKGKPYEKTLLTFSVQGRYEGIRRLIYEIESFQYFLIIEDMDLQKKQDKVQNLITLQVKVAAFTK